MAGFSGKGTSRFLSVMTRKTEDCSINSISVGQEYRSRYIAESSIFDIFGGVKILQIFAITV